MKVVRLTPDDAEALRKLRLEALALHPTAFTADPDTERTLTLDDWRARIKQNACFGGIVEDELIAMAALLIEPSIKTKHTGRLVSMYVRESQRGTGLADALMGEVLSHAAGCVQQVILGVEAANTRAIKFYQRHGFRPVGKIPRAILVDGSYFDELQMFLALPKSR